jgi:hypothetical protein
MGLSSKVGSGPQHLCLPTMSSVVHTRSGRPPRPANPSLQLLAKKRTSTGKLRCPRHDPEYYVAKLETYEEPRPAVRHPAHLY